MADYNNPELIAEYRKELEKINKIEGELTDKQKERKKSLEETIKNYENQRENLEKSIELQKEYIKGLDTLNKSLDSSILKREATQELLKKELEILKQRFNDEEKNRNALDEEIKKKQAQIDANEQILEVQKDINKSADLSTELSKKFTKQTLKALAAMENKAAAMKSMFGGALRMADAGASKFISAQVGAIDSLVKAYDAATTSFEKQYALGNVYQGQIKGLYKEMNNYGASIEDVTKAYGELATGFTDFTMLADKQREAIAESAITMERAYGIAQGDFAKGMQNASKMMGMTAIQAETYQRELAATAEALGLPPAQLASQFASMGPQFAKFGNQAGKAFKDLARISKITGMELEKVLAITNKFDTFEGAAEQAGQLNAALGGNFVNAMDLMMATDPAERFEMIRDAITSTGLTFDDMSYYQKQFYTNALGLSDVGDLALMMSGRMDMMAGSSNQSAKSLIEQKERAAELMTVQEKLNAALADNAEDLIDLIPLLKDAATFMQKYADAILITAGVFKLLSIFAGAYQGYMLFKLAKAPAELAAEASLTGAKKAQAAANLELAGSLKVLAAAQTEQGVAQAAASKGAYTAAAGMAAFGVAVAGIGAGIWMAGQGIALMADSFRDLSDTATDKLVNVLLGMGVALVALTVGIYAIGTAGTVSAVGILAFGAAVALVGLGVGLAAAGIGLMAEGLTTMSTIDGGLLNFAVGLAAVAAAIYAIGVALAVMGNPLAVTGLGVLAGLAAVGTVVGFAISAIAKTFKKEKDNMEGMAEVMAAMGDVTADEVERIQTSFVGIKNAINDISGMKLAALAMSLGKINVDVGVPASQMQRAQTPTQKNQSTPKNQGKIGEILIKFDNDMFEQEVVEIVKTEQGKYAIAAASGRE